MCRLLDLPNGLRFRKLVFSWTHKADVPWIMELLIRCSDILECLDVMCHLPREFTLILRRSYTLPLPPSSSRFGVGSFDQPFKGDKTQKCSFSGRVVDGQMGHCGAPDHHTRTSRSLRNFNPRILLVDWFQYQGSHGRSGLWTVVGP